MYETHEKVPENLGLLLEPRIEKPIKEFLPDGEEVLVE
jgi:hypothetical protein